MYHFLSNFCHSSILSAILPFRHSFCHSAFPLFRPFCPSRHFCNSVIPPQFRHSALPSSQHSAIRLSTIPPFRHSASHSAIPLFRSFCPSHHFCDSVIPPPFHHSAIPLFRHPAIPPFRNSPFHHSTIPLPFRHSAIQLLMSTNAEAFCHFIPFHAPIKSQYYYE